MQPWEVPALAPRPPGGQAGALSLQKGTLPVRRSEGFPGRPRGPSRPQVSHCHEREAAEEDPGGGPHATLPGIWGGRGGALKTWLSGQGAPGQGLPEEGGTPTGPHAGGERALEGPGCGAAGAGGIRAANGSEGEGPPHLGEQAPARLSVPSPPPPLQCHSWESAGAAELHWARPPGRSAGSLRAPPLPPPARSGASARTPKSGRDPPGHPGSGGRGGGRTWGGGALPRPLLPRGPRGRLRRLLAVAPAVPEPGQEGGQQGQQHRRPRRPQRDLLVGAARRWRRRRRGGRRGAVALLAQGHGWLAGARAGREGGRAARREAQPERGRTCPLPAPYMRPGREPGICPAGGGAAAARRGGVQGAPRGARARCSLLRPPALPPPPWRRHAPRARARPGPARLPSCSLTLARALLRRSLPPSEAFPAMEALCAKPAGPRPEGQAVEEAPGKEKGAGAGEAKAPPGAAARGSAPLRAEPVPWRARLRGGGGGMQWRSQGARDLGSRTIL